MDHSNSLFEPIVKPIEKISMIIAAEVALPRFKRFLFRKKKPSNIPAINGISKLGKLGIIRTNVRFDYHCSIESIKLFRCSTK
jgi:hypothetical protein